MNNPMSHPMPERYYDLLEKIQEVDFVLVELNLYLDTHPEDTEAIGQYNMYAQTSKMLKAEFEAHFGPLQGFGGSCSRYPWEWSEAPWPWQV